MMKNLKPIVTAILIAGSSSALAECPEPQTCNFVIKNFEFQSGDVLPEMNVAYMTIGDPAGAPV